jgi:hypothetical protein
VTSGCKVITTCFLSKAGLDVRSESYLRRGRDSLMKLRPDVRKLLEVTMKLLTDILRHLCLDIDERILFTYNVQSISPRKHKFKKTVYFLCMLFDISSFFFVPSCTPVA